MPRRPSRPRATLGRPVALKAIAEGLVHKSDAGGVLLGLADADAVREAALEIEAAVTRAGHPLEGLVVQPMVPTGPELIVGVVNDRSFGPVLACGAGGTTAELIKDVAVRITPVTDLDAHEMLRSLQTFPLLDGYRGAPRCDISAIEDVLLRVSAMVDAHPEIVELDSTRWSPRRTAPSSSTPACASRTRRRRCRCHRSGRSRPLTAAHGAAVKYGAGRAIAPDGMRAASRLSFGVWQRR